MDQTSKRFFVGAVAAAAMLTGLTSSTMGETKSFPLVKNGEATSVVVISKQTETEPLFAGRQTVTVEGAARELIGYVKAITGVELPLVRVDESELDSGKAYQQGKRPIYLGALGIKKLGAPGERAQEALDDPSGFVIKATADEVAVAGSTPRGTEIGVHSMLEQFGVRWFFPGELGTVVPSSKELALDYQETAERPTFAGRHFQLLNAETWIRHQKVGGPRLPSAHGIDLGKTATFEAHPEYYALVKGSRNQAQLCLTNPEVLRLAVEQAKSYFKQNPDSPWYGMGPNDAGGFCGCPDCVALDGEDWDPFSSEMSVTDRYVWFFNQVLAQLEGEYPDKKILFYVYHAYMRPPVKVKPNERIVGAIAPIALCRIHGLSNPVCSERGYLKEIIAAWSKVIPEFYERGYWFNLADPGAMFVQTHRLRDEIPYYAEMGCKGFRTECLGHWAAEGPSLYVAGRLLWNAKANVDDVIKDFCEKLFGPAAEPMEEYFSFLDERLKNGDHHTGSIFNLLDFYPKPVREKALSLLEKAKALAVASPYKERVELFSQGFSYTDALAEMFAARNNHDWAKAYASLQEVDRLQKILLNYDAPMLSPVGAPSFMRRFFRLPVEQGYARTTNGNQVVAFLDDEWQSLLDPQKLGDALRFQGAEFTGGNWQPTRTHTTTWSDLGLRYYKGLAWYRQEVEIPSKFDGKRVFLWFGGVDEQARIWVNGELVGTGPGSAMTPFEVDATKALKPGKNVVTVCVANLRTDELGTGGIIFPAFFYAPAKGDAAELDNVKALKNTFP